MRRARRSALLATSLPDLPDELIQRVLEVLVHVDAHAEQASLPALCRVAAAAAAALATTSKRLWSALKGTAALAEAEAMRHTFLKPSSTFVEQARAERRSEALVDSLLKASERGALHCSGKCCLQKRRLLLREGVAKLVPVPATGFVHLVAHDGEGTTFVVARHRVGGVVCETLQAFRRGCRAVVSLDEAGCFAPFDIAASAGSVAVVRPAIFSPCSSVARVWWAGFDAVVALRAPEEFQRVGCACAQAVWYGSGALTVLFSATTILPEGATLVHHPGWRPLFGVARYEHGADAPFWHSSTFDDEVSAHSAAASGNLVALLTRERCGVNVIAPRHTSVLSIGETTRRRRVRHRLHRTMLHPADRLQSPCAVGLSPSGDVLVSVHRVAERLLVETLLRAGDDFLPHSLVDACVPSVQPALHPAPEYVDAAAMGNTIARAYHISFSPCGRHAVLVDGRVAARLPYPGPAALAFDVVSGAARPLQSCAATAPRGFGWDGAAVVLCRHGAAWLRPS